MFSDGVFNLAFDEELNKSPSDIRISLTSADDETHRKELQGRGRNFTHLPIAKRKDSDDGHVGGLNKSPASNHVSDHGDAADNEEKNDSVKEMTD